MQRTQLVINPSAGKPHTNHYRGCDARQGFFKIGAVLLVDSVQAICGDLLLNFCRD